MLIQHLPNILTLFRVIAAPAVGLLLVLSATGALNAEQGLPVALALFAMACLSDVFDGILARRMGQETLLGAVLDPVADKLLMLFAGLGLAVLVPEVSVVAPIALMLSRDLLVGGLREAALTQNWRMEVRGLGKFKTVAQCQKAVESAQSEAF